MGNDTIDLLGGLVQGDVHGDGISLAAGSSGGNDLITLDGATLNANIYGDIGVDTILLKSGRIDGSVFWGAGDEGQTLDLTGVTLGGSLDFGAGSDNFSLIGGNVGENVQAGSEDDTFVLNGGNVGMSIFGGTGNDVINLMRGSVGETVEGDLGNDIFRLAGANVSEGVNGGDGNDTAFWTSGTLGSFNGGRGSDSLTVSAAEYTGGVQLDGGDDASGNDGMVDTLTVQGRTISANGANLLNWEKIVLDQSTLSLTNHALTAGSGADLGLFLTNSSTLNGDSGLALTGNMDIDGASKFVGGGGGNGAFRISGLIRNAGAIELANGATGDVLTVSGQYIGAGGVLSFDTALGGDNSATDMLAAEGGASGTADIRVTPMLASLGAPTTQGIKIIDVTGVSDGVFALLGDYEFRGSKAVVAGAYSYRLFKGGVSTPNDGDWYLRSALTDSRPGDPPLFQPGTPVYETYAQHLLGLNSLSTLQQRAGNRAWSLTGSNPGAPGNNPPPALADARSGDTHMHGPLGLWARGYAAFSHVRPDKSTAGARYDQTVQGTQAGFDAPLATSVYGELIGGVTLNYTHSATSVTSPHGDGRIDTNAYGVGGTLTWYGVNGFYADAQAQADWYDSNLTSTITGSGLASGNNALGYALSLEAGQKIGLGSGLSVTPQGQAIYSNVRFSSFTDTFESAVALDDGQSLRGRIGLSLDHDDALQAADGALSWRHLYGVANLHQELLGATKIDVAGTKFVSQLDATSASVGLGGSYNWKNDAYSLYGEAAVETGLSDFGSTYQLKATAGTKVKL